MSDDPQDQAEALDEDVVDSADDTGGDAYGDALADYPPEELQLPLEALDEVPELDAADEPELIVDDAPIGQLVDTDVNGLDEEARLIGEVQPGEPLDPETAALHLEPEPE